jgi:serine/threonine-protein kinase PknK
MQTKLLRVLEDGMVRPVGGEHAKKVDVRVVAATHRDLRGMVDSGSFREDLYYRLSIVPVHVPALRERREDIPALVQHLLAKHAPGGHVRVTAEALTLLCAANWPGNVRQLENEIRRALVLGGEEIGVEQLTPGLGEASMSAARHTPRLGRASLREEVDALEASLVREALVHTEGNQTKAAKELGLSRYGLQKMMKRLGVQH